MKMTSINPADNTLVWQGNITQAAEVKYVVAQAHQAFQNWSLLSPQQRISYLKRFADVVAAERGALAEMISRETGKPYWESLTEVSAVIGKIDISIQALYERNPVKQTPTADGQSCLRFKPHGVVAVLGAFNFPAHLSNGHIVPALLAGNTVVYKPSELCPGVAELIMQCWQKAQLPKGVLQCIQGDASTGEALLTADIQGVYFTGSYQTGRKIHALFAGRPEIILALEMGGNNPLIIEEVKHLNAAITLTLLSTLITAGQRCTCARRILIPDNAWGDEFVMKLIQAYQTIKIGAYQDRPEPFMGPVIRYEHAIKHLKSQQTLLDLGGVALLKATLIKDSTGFLSPGLIDMTQVSNPPDEEIFAPITQIIRYRQLTDALQLANQTRYGLVAGLISENEAHYQQFYQTIRAGLINWNKPTTGAASNLPFGGVGTSGNHRPSAYFAADYCAYPIASQEQPQALTPIPPLPGMPQ